MRIEFTVEGKPVSVNNLWRKGRYGQTYVTSAAEDWHRDVAMVARQARIRAKHQADKTTCWRISIDVFWKDKRRHDIDNAAKVILDAMRNIIYADDSQVWELFIKKQFGTPKAVIVAETLDPTQ